CSCFFSSRRRHTRSKRDWSSDVCSSDLTGSSQRGAWRAVAGSLPEGELAELARAVAAGADPRRAGPSRLAGTELISTLAAALTICERTGAPTAGVLQNLADALRDLHDASLARRTA